MANVLSEEKKQQLALGRLGWSLRKIQQATRIRRETASQYLKATEVAVRPPGGWGRWAARPAISVITEPNGNPNPNLIEWSSLSNPGSTSGRISPTLAYVTIQQTQGRFGLVVIPLGVPRWRVVFEKVIKHL
jgi:hypothetical protein